MSVTKKSTYISARTRNSLLTTLAFGCIYLIWGSTYLAIRYAIETVPPFFVAGLRHLIAGVLLFAWCRWRGLRATNEQWFAAFLLAIFFFLIGHGTLHWAQQTLPSGLAALLIATEPIIIAMLIGVRRDSGFTPKLVIGLILGVAGVALLVGNDMRAGPRELISSIVVLLGTVSWAIGMLYSRSAKLHPDRVMTAAMTLLAGAAMLLVLWAAVGESSQLHLYQVSSKSVFAILYLAIAGSLLSYLAYFWLLDRYSPTLISTHTYINPVIALILGWAVAGEQLSGRMLFAAAMVVIAVILVSHATRRQTAAAKKGSRGKARVIEQSADCHP
jgi:drug/metabolite transporter (DMT)-like permease